MFSDELSADGLREAATADCLRRAFAVPSGEAPAAFASMLRRLGEADRARRSPAPPPPDARAAPRRAAV